MWPVLQAEKCAGILDKLTSRADSGAVFDTFDKHHCSRVMLHLSVASAAEVQSLMNVRIPPPLHVA